MNATMPSSLPMGARVDYDAIDRRRSTGTVTGVTGESAKITRDDDGHDAWYDNFHAPRWAIRVLAPGEPGFERRPTPTTISRADYELVARERDAAIRERDAANDRAAKLQEDARVLAGRLTDSFTRERETVERSETATSMMAGEPHPLLLLRQVTRTALGLKGADDPMVIGLLAELDTDIDRVAKILGIDMSTWRSAGVWMQSPMVLLVEIGRELVTRTLDVDGIAFGDLCGSYAGYIDEVKSRVDP